MNSASHSFFEVNRSNHNFTIREHFSKLVSTYPKLANLNPYYRNCVLRWLKSVLPEQRRVLDFGCGDGFFVNSLNPSEGQGVDISTDLVEIARKKYPSLKFSSVEAESFNGEGQFDAVLLLGVVEYLYDIGAVLKSAHRSLDTNGRVYIATGNPLWKPIFSLASLLGLRFPDCPRNYLTNKDLINLLIMNDFEVVSEEMAIMAPKYIPIISPFLNWLLPKIPALKYLCSSQYLIGRKIENTDLQYSVSVVIPCHNEEDNVERCIRSVKKWGVATEVIFVDDASTDETVDRVQNLQNIRSDVDIRLISYPENQGKGFAVKQGFDSANGDIIFILDADLTTHPEELEDIYKAMSSGRAEFINCTRMIYPMEERSMKWLNYVGNKIFNILVSFTLGTRVSDTLCGTKACFKKDYQYFQMGRDPWGDYDFLFGAAQLRLSFLELPIHYYERIAGQSKMNSIRHSINLLKMCFLGFFQIWFQRPIVKMNGLTK